jgi:glycosyltransferase involved in cell wall biosynthesis
MLHIGLDARPLTGKRTGIGRYVLELCQALDRLLPGARFYAYAPQPLSAPLPSERWQARISPRYQARMGGFLWLRTFAGGLTAQDPLDVFFATRTLLPRLRPGVRSVSLVHDLNHVLVPETMTPLNRLAHRLHFARDVRRADHVVANSQGTSRRLEQHHGRGADLVVPPGIAAVFGPAGSDTAHARLRALGVRAPFLLSVAALEPRKNIAALVEAFLALRGRGALSDHQLVLTGPPGWNQGRLERRLAAGLPGVVRLGFVSDEDLAALYATTAAFVFPSLYEGFGIPVAEALACGARVVATDIPELREAAGDEGVFTGTSADEIAAGILVALARPRPEPRQASRDEAHAALAALFSR